MKITIAQRQKLFSHTPGTACVLPGTNWVVQAFPTQLRMKQFEAKFELTGPVEQFTVEQDLEKECVRVFGKAKEGFFRVRVQASDAGIEVVGEKGKVPTLHFPVELMRAASKPLERLSLGSHKALNWDSAVQECDLKRLVPALFILGQKIPQVLPQPLTGTARLLEWKDAQGLENFFRAAFTKMLVPRLADDQFQGLAPEEPEEGDRFFLIQEGAKRIRAMFFQQNDRRLKWLPELPREFESGRMVNVQANGIGAIDLEWTKGRMRQAIVRGTTTGDVLLDLQKEIDSFRVRTKLHEKGKKVARDEPLFVEAGKTYFLDHFQK